MENRLKQIKDELFYYSCSSNYHKKHNDYIEKLFQEHDMIERSLKWLIKLKSYTMN